MAGIRTENKIYEVGIYCRLSKDDGTDNESASIATQKSILTDYVKRQGWHLAKTYVDDGYSGTNFQRPSFQNMIKDIENGLINCVITKDLSRLGRNYLDCGLYLEVFFPEHNVRYIAVNDGVDTLNKSAMDITPFRNILNEMYSADVSVKIKSAYRARFQQGKFMGTTAPYGYVKDPADHNHLLIDDKVAHVVREIFDLALAGNGIAKIRKHINKQHILRPAAYAVEQGATGYERYFEDNEENRYIWSENSVRGILRSPIYAGNLAGYKRIAANMKSKKRPSKLPEEWEVIPDTHEGIVTQEEFDTVQQLMTSRRREQNAGGFENIFSGVIKCADCGYAMRAASANRRKRPDIIDCVQYTCNNYGRYGNVMCTAHSIEARDLFNAVLADINRFADMAVNDEKAVRAIERRLTETDQSRAKSLEKEKKKLNKRLAELDRLFSSLYEDKVMERITERNFEMMSGKYQKEQLEIEARLKEVTETLNDSYEKSQGVRDFLSLIRNYQGLKELDATIINALIDKILVSEREKLADGTVRQEIKIYYKFIGFVGELHITPTKRWTALKPKNCTVCGVEYVPSSGISKYCPACAKRIQREKSNESKRRSRERNRRACIELSAKNDRLNLIAQSGLQEIGLSFGFFEYAIVGLPILIAGILFYTTIGFSLLPNHPAPAKETVCPMPEEAIAAEHVSAWKQIVSLVVLILTLLAMIFEKQIGVKLCVSGCIGALVLILTGVISEENALKAIDLRTIFLFGGTLSLAAALAETGAGELIAHSVIRALGNQPSPYLLTFTVFILCCALTNFMSNTATTALMVPICLSIAQGMGADPRAVLMACVIGGSCAYATPIGMPANTMVVGIGGFHFRDFVKAGLPLIGIATITSMIILPVAFPFFPG